jgi:hypothetical protein
MEIDLSSDPNTIFKDEIFIELVNNQLKHIPHEKKLTHSDFKRISYYLTKTIFGKECSIWNAPVIKNNTSQTYVNFYFNGKKYSLQRLLYLNFIGDLTQSEYIKFNCPNKGICCNITHFYKNIKSDTNIKSVPIISNQTENKSISKYKLNMVMFN